MIIIVTIIYIINIRLICFLVDAFVYKCFLISDPKHRYHIAASYSRKDFKICFLLNIYYFKQDD